MKNKFKFLTKESLKRKIDTKWFKIVNIILCLAIICGFNIDSIINAFGGDFNEKTKVYVVDNAGVYDIFNGQIDYSNNILNTDSDSAYIVSKYDGTFDEAKEEASNDSHIIVLEFDNSDTDIIDVTMLSKAYIELSDITILNNAINSTKSALAIIKYNINPDQLKDIYTSVNINREFLDEEKNNTDENMEVIMSTVFSVIIVPFFMLSILLVQMIGAEVNDEKTTRGMEIIISNVSPEVHLASKVAAGNLFVLFQGLLLVVYVVLGFLIRHFTGGDAIANGVGSYITNIINQVINSNFMGTLNYVIPLVLILMIITFIAYSLVAGVLASMTTNIEDFQQVQSPIMIISLVVYYLSMMAGMFKGSLFIRILSYIPFISAILSPSLLVLGQVGIIDVIISIFIVILLVWWLVKYGIRIYKVGILNYSSKDLWKRMFKAIKNK